MMVLGRGRRVGSAFALDGGCGDRYRRKAITTSLPRQVTAMDDQRAFTRTRAPLPQSVDEQQRGRWDRVRRGGAARQRLHDAALAIVVGDAGVECPGQRCKRSCVAIPRLCVRDCNGSRRLRLTGNVCTTAGRGSPRAISAAQGVRHPVAPREAHRRLVRASDRENIVTREPPDALSRPPRRTRRASAPVPPQ